MGTDKKKEEIDLAEESDRGAVIVAAAILEDDLAKVLETILVANDVPEKHRKEMFDVNGPLSSFSSKMLICYGFGLISRDVFDDLTKIRRLRNRFAHSSGDVDFFSEEINSIVFNLKCTELPRKEFEGKRYSPSGEKPPKEWEMRSAGLLKYPKAVFCIGVQMLRVEIIRCQLAKLKGEAI